MLFEAGANQSIKSLDGVTPLHIAVYNNFICMAQILIHHDADLHAKSEWGTILDMAALKEQTAMLEMLWNHDFNLLER